MYYLSNFGKNNKTIYGVWWKNRSTSTVVSAANSSEARKKAIQKKKEGI